LRAAFLLWRNVPENAKNAAFAASIRRDIIQQGADMMGLPLGEVLADWIEVGARIWRRSARLEA